MVKTILELYKKYKEIINYLIFGGLTTLVNLITYFICTRILNLDETLSSGISWFVAIVFAYITNKIFVFNKKTENTKQTVKEVGLFVFFRVLTGAIFEIYLFNLLISLAGVQYDVIVKFIVLVLVVISNYIFSKLIIFKKKKELQ